MSQVEFKTCKELVADAMTITCFLINILTRESLDGKVTEKVWTDSAVYKFDLKVFGCPASMHVSSEKIGSITI